MSIKKVKVKTRNSGQRYYRIENAYGKFNCYREHAWSNEKIGSTSSMEDALSIISYHANKHFGGVRDMSIH